MLPRKKTRLFGAIVFACALVLYIGAPPKLESFALGALIGVGFCLAVVPETLLKKQTMAELQGFMGDFWTRDLK